MPSVTKYPRTITQQSATNRCSWNNLNNLKNNNDTFAKTNKIGKKNTTTKDPAWITCTNFGFDIPVGAEITGIEVEYAHQKLGVDGKYPSIGPIAIKLLSTGLPTWANFVEGRTPTSTLRERTYKFYGEATVEVATGRMTGGGIVGGPEPTMEMVQRTLTYDVPQRNRVNNNDFGVQVDYPANTSDHEGYLQLKYIRITVHYKESQYTVSVTSLNGSNVYQNTLFDLKLSVTNVNSTDYPNRLRLTLPSGAIVTNVEDVVGYSNWSIEGDNKYIWEPPFSKNLKTATINLQVYLTTFGTNTITLKELLNGVSKSIQIIVDPTPTGVSEDTTTVADETIYAVQNQFCTVPLQIPEGTTGNVTVACDEAVTYKLDGTSTSKNADEEFSIPVSSFTDNALDLELKTSSTGIVHFYLQTNTAPYKVIKVIPENLDGPQTSVICLTEEEMNRLGNGYTYNVKTFMRVLFDVLHQSADDNFHDYYRNYRLGVVNSIPETRNILTIFNACNNWSSLVTEFNTWQEKSVQFTYDENYPVYIIVTGGYSDETTLINIQFAHISIQETDYDEYENHGTFPDPILNCIVDENTSSLHLESQSNSNDLILYEFPFEEGFGTNDKYAIRGIELELTAETDDRVVCNATLQLPNGEIGQESIILTPGESRFTIGGKYDLWGFGIGEITDISKIELLINFLKLLDLQNADAEVNIQECILTVYFTKLDIGAVNKIYVEGENLEWYNAFIQDFKMVSGIKTDTKYLNVDGSDTNDAYNMSIDDKEIELEFDIDGCTLEESTELLQQITKLLTNRRDKLNRPIPKVIETNIHPDEYWEYILEDGIDASVDYTGYTCKAKLTIPSGTSFNKEDSITSSTGIIDSITKVNPIITIIPTDENIELLEENSNQKFSAGNTEWVNKIVEINCEDRTVILKESEDENAEGENISYSADINNDWFILDGRYKFNATGCVIQTVRTTGRN